MHTCMLAAVIDVLVQDKMLFGIMGAILVIITSAIFVNR